MKKIILFSLIILFFSGCYSEKYFEEIKYSFENVKFINILPLQYKDWFLKRNIYIDDYCLPDDKIKNINLINWKYRWGIWISNHKNASKADIIWKLTKMLENKGFDKILVLYNKNSKDSTIDLKLIKGNGIFSKIVKISRYFLYNKNIFLVFFYLFIVFWFINILYIAGLGNITTFLFIILIIIFMLILAYILYFYLDVAVILFLILAILMSNTDEYGYLIIPIKK